MRGRPHLVTGGAGFIGTNLAARLIEDGHEVIVVDNLSREGTQANLDWLVQFGAEALRVVEADIRDAEAMAPLVRGCGTVHHLAAQVAVTSSIAAPANDLSINVLGTHQLLEQVRLINPAAAFLFASTNKVYGDLSTIPLELTGQGYLPADPLLRATGVGEGEPLAFSTPYGCSKGAADQYVLDYARTYGLDAVVFRMSCIYGPHQNGTEDQGWVAHFARCALAGAPVTVFGDGHQVRDLLHVEDAVAAYVAAARCARTVRGRAYNLGGGPENAASVNAVLALLRELVSEPFEIRQGPWRPADQLYYVSDARMARSELALPPPRGWRSGLADLVTWLARTDMGRPPEPLRGAMPISVEARA